MLRLLKKNRHTLRTAEELSISLVCSLKDVAIREGIIFYCLAEKKSVIRASRNFVECSSHIKL